MLHTPSGVVLLAPVVLCSIHCMLCDTTAVHTLCPCVYVCIHVLRYNLFRPRRGLRDMDLGRSRHSAG